MSYIVDYFCTYSLLHWLLVSGFVVLFLYFTSLFFREKGVFVWLQAVNFLFFCRIFFLHPQSSVKTALNVCLILSFIVLFFSPVFLFRRKKKGKKAGERIAIGQVKRMPPRTVIEPVSDRIVAGEVSPMSVVTSIREVQLSYAFEILRKLSRSKLNERDRMEMDIIQNMLTIYRAKEQLSTEEMHALNGYLSSLLKLMAAYSV